MTQLIDISVLGLDINGNVWHYVKYTALWMEL